MHLGATVRTVHGGSTVFIPANTLISLSNVGSDVIGMVFVFSAPGFEEFMGEASARDGEENVPISSAEDAAMQRKHAHAVVYQ